MVTITNPSYSANRTPANRLARRKAMWLMMAVAPAAALLSSPASAATQTWVGAGGVDNTFTNSANWAGGAVPSPGDTLIFDGNLDLTANNNFNTGTQFGGLQFAPTVAGPFNVTGFALNLSGNIMDNTQSITNTISLAGIGLLSNTTVDVVNTGSLVISSPISGANGLTKTDSGTLTLTGNNTFTGPLTISGGAVSIASDSALGAVPATATPGQLVIGDTAVLKTTANITLGGANGTRGVLLPSGTGTIDTATGTVLTYNGVIAGSGGLGKTSFGTIVLGGTSTYSGGTAVENGILNLNFAQTGAPSSNIINPGSALSVGGTNAGLGSTSYAQLLITGSANTAVSQTFSSTTFNLGPNIIRLTNGNGTNSNITLNLGSLTANAGAVAVFNLPTKGFISTTSGTANQILGGWATVGLANNTQNNVAQGSDWAMVDGNGHIVAYNGYTAWNSGTIPSNGFPATANLQNTNGANLNFANDSAGVTVDINTLELNGVLNNQALAVGTNNTLRFGASGGLLVNSNSAVTMYIGETGANQHNVGTITAGGAPNTPGTFYLTVNANSESSGAVRIGSVLADNGSGKLTFVKAGAGNVKIDGANTYTGDTYILQGRVQMTGNENGGTANPTAFGFGTVHVYPGAYIFPSGIGIGPLANNLDLAGIGTDAEPIGALRLGNGLVVSGNISLSGDARVGGGNGVATVLSGAITGNHNFDLGAGSSIASNFAISNTGNAWTGNTTIVARTGATAGNTIIHLGASEVIPDGFGKGNLIFGISGDTVSTMTLDLNGFNETVNGVLTGTGSTAALGFIEDDAPTTNATLTLGNNDQTANFGGTIQNGSSAVAITKIGKGMQTLSGTNTYTGDTNINQGTVAVTGTLASSGFVRVNTSNTTAGTLSGTGTVGNVILAANTGANAAAISPGVNSGDIATLTVNSLTVNGGTLNLDLGGGGTSDKIVSTGAVSFAGPSLINPSAGALAGTYTVLTAPSISYGVAPTLNIPQNTRLTFSDTLSATSIVINVTGQVANLTWTGATNSLWDVRNTPNWTSNAASNPNIFFFGDNVTFDDSAPSANANVTLNTVMLSGNMLVNSNTNNYSFSGAGGIGGAGSLTKNGSSVLTLNTANSYSGGTFFNSGTLNINSSTALGSGPVTFAGGTIDNTSGRSVSLTSNNTQNWSANINFTGTGNLGLGAGNVTLIGGSRTVTVNANTLTVGGPIGDGGLSLGLTKAGAGTLALNGNSTYSGSTNINAGTVQIGSTSAFGANASATVNIASGATLDVGGFAAANAAGALPQQINVAGTGVGAAGAIINSSNLSQQNVLMNVNLTGDATFGGIGRFDVRSTTANTTLGILNLNGHTLTKIGTGQFSVVDTNVSAGNIVVSSGTLSLEATTNVGSNVTISYANGTFGQFFANTGTIVAPMSVSGNVTMGNADNVNLATIGSNITLGSSAILTFGPVNAGAGNGNLTHTGFITQSDPSNPGSVVVTTTGTVTLSNPNTYSGGTTLNAGTLNFSNLSNLGSGNITFGAGTLQYSNVTLNTDDISLRSVTINGLAGIDTNGSNVVVYTNSIGNGGAGGINKLGFGTLTLNGANTFTGASAINNGVLQIGNSSALAPFGALAINSNSTASTAGILDLNGFNVAIGPLSGTGTIQDNVGGAVTLTINTANGTATTFSGSISSGGPALALKVTSNGTGAGTLALTSGANPYSGGTTIDGGAMLQVNGAGSYGSGPLTIANGTFDVLAAFNSNNENHAITLTSPNSTIQTEAGAVYTNNSFTIGGSGTLNKAGPGTVILGGTDTYTGGTKVNGGVLIVNTSLTSTGAVSVNASNTTAGILSGNGGSMGPLTVSAANGTNVPTVSPGATEQPNNFGTLTVASLTVNGGKFAIDLGNGQSDEITANGTASFAAASTFNIVPNLSLSSGSYTILQAGTLTLGTQPTFVLIEPLSNITFSNGSASFGRSTFTLDLNTPNQIKIDVNAPGSANLIWTGAVNSTWDIAAANGTPAGTANWLGGSNTTFVQLDNVTFNDTGSNTNITLNKQTISNQAIPGSVTFNNSVKTYNITGNGSIAGPTSLVKNGTGTVGLGTANAYTGGTTLNAGTLSINNAGALGTGPLTITGGNLDTNAAANSTITLTGVTTIAANADFGFVGTGNLSLGSIPVTITATRTINVANNTLTIGGTISDGGSFLGITKTGNGTLALNGSNSLGGQVNINGGVIQVGNFAALGNNTLGVNVNNGGTLDVGGFTAANTAVPAAPAVTFATSGVTIAGNGAATTAFPAGEGALVNTNSSNNSQQNAFSLVNLAANSSFGGTARFDVRATQVNGFNVAKLNLNGNTLTKLGPNQVSIVSTDISTGSIVVNGGSIVAANGTLTTTGVLSLEASTSTGVQGPNSPDLSGNITYNTGANAAFFQNPGLAASTTANAANGSLEITAITWPMTFNGNNTIGNGGATVAIIDSNATLNGNVTFEAISGAVPSLTGNDPLRWAGVVSGTGSLTKLGAASLVLMNTANSYSGGTAIDGGILQFSNLSQLGTGNISFAGGTLQYNFNNSNNTDDISTRTVTIFGASTSNINGQSNIALAGGATIDTNGQNVNFANPIGGNGNGSLTKAGLGNLTLNGANSYTGGTTVSNGTLFVAAGASIASANSTTISVGPSGTLNVAATASFTATPSLAANGNVLLNNAADTFGTFTGSGNVALNGTALTINNGGNFLGVLSGTGNLTVAANAATTTLVLSGTNMFTGGTTITKGVLSVGADTNLGNASNPLTVNGGTIQITGIFFHSFGRPFNWGPSDSGIDVNAANNTFTISQALSGPGLTKAGAGTLVLSGNYSSSNSTVVSAGTLTLNGTTNTAAGITGTANGTLVVGTGTKASLGLASDGITGGVALNVIGAAQVRTNGTASGTSLLSSLTFGNANSSFDIVNNKLILQPTTSKATAIASLKTNVAAGQLNATGLSVNYAIAVVDNGDAGLSTFGGAAVNSNSILVSQELLGDANLDGIVNGADITAVLNHFGNPTNSWSQGNFDGGPTIDLTDLSYVLNNFGLTNPNASAAPGTFGGNPTATPEPTSLAVLASGAAMLLSRRRKVCRS